MKSFKLALALFAFGILTSFTIPSNSLKFEKSNLVDPAVEGAETSVEYRIQLAAYQGEVPSSDLEKLNKIENVTSLDSKGKTVFVTAPFDSEYDASMELPELRNQGFKNAVKVVIIEDYVITARAYHLFYDNKNCSQQDKNKLFTTEYRVLD